MKCCIYRQLAFFFVLLASSSAHAEQKPVAFSLAMRARVADASRTRETIFEVKPEEGRLAFKKLSKWRGEDVEVELLPRFVERSEMFFSYRVLKQQSGKWTPILSGDLKASLGQVTHLFAGDHKYGNLVDLAIRVQQNGQSQTPSKGNPTSAERFSTRKSPATFDRI